MPQQLTRTLPIRQAETLQARQGHSSAEVLNLLRVLSCLLDDGEEVGLALEDPLHEVLPHVRAGPIPQQPIQGDLCQGRRQWPWVEREAWGTQRTACDERRTMCPLLNAAQGFFASAQAAYRVPRPNPSGSY